MLSVSFYKEQGFDVLGTDVSLYCLSVSVVITVMTPTMACGIGGVTIPLVIVMATSVLDLLY